MTSETDEVGDRWWETNDGRHTRKGEQAIKPDTTTEDKLIGRQKTWETHGERYLMIDKWKQKKDIWRAGYH